MNHCETTQTGRNVGHTIVAILLIVLAACNAPGEEPASTDATPTATKVAIESPTVTEAASRHWVIIEKRRAEKMGVAEWLYQSEGFWTPSTDDVLELEKEIGEYLHENSGQFPRHPSIWERLDEYRRQYVGYEIGGKRIIHGNFFCSYEGVDWQQRFLMALDGGDCYFQVDYDVESGSFIGLHVNGEA